MCILLVDDEPLIVMVAEDALQESGHEVITAEGAAAAIELIALYPDRFTCLVTDLHMPGILGGADLVEHMREQYPIIPVVVATGRPDMVTPGWRKQHQVALVEKPYSPMALVEIVEGLLNNMQASDRSVFWGAALVSMEGRTAYKARVQRSQNPYGFGTRERDSWAEGWDRADDELRQ